VPADLGQTSGVHLLHSAPRLLERLEALGAGSVAVDRAARAG